MLSEEVLINFIFCCIGWPFFKQTPHNFTQFTNLWHFWESVYECTESVVRIVLTKDAIMDRIYTDFSGFGIASLSHNWNVTRLLSPYYYHHLIPEDVWNYNFGNCTRKLLKTTSKYLFWGVSHISIFVRNVS